MEFRKGHGTGNDFVLLPDPDGQLALTPALVAALCDRRRGIGADGVLRVVRSAKHPDAANHATDAEWFMDYWNADGSSAEMCGNGVRVFTRFLIDSGWAAPAAGGLPVATRTGIVRVVVGEGSIAVDMGLPRRYARSAASVAGRSVPGIAVNVGNPHLVCPLPPDVPLSTVDLSGPPGFDKTLFPAGVNVEFFAPVPGPGVHVRMRVHERGVGETLSCGSGACAVAAVAADAGVGSRGTVVVEVPGGRLTVEFDGTTCWLAGPAVLVARGEVDAAALAA
ncbi:MAG TPA: diaminopimelate epimerase [Micromonosporaceae bacterium]